MNLNFTRVGYGFRFLFLLFCFSGTYPSLIQADEVTLEEIKNEWNVYETEFRKLSEQRVALASKSRTVESELSTSGQLKRYTVQVNASEPTILLANDRYFAILRGQKGLNQTSTHVLEKLIPKDESFKPEDLGPQFIPLQNNPTSIRGIAGIACNARLLLHHDCVVKKIEKTSESNVLIYYSKSDSRTPPQVPTPPRPPTPDELLGQLLDFFPEGTFLLKPDYHYAILEFNGRNISTGTEATETFSDYERIDNALWYPKLLTSTRKGANTSVTTEKLLSASVKPASSRRSFYVAHYGITEPGGESNWTSQSLVWFAAVSGFTFIIAIYAYKKYFAK